LTITGALGEEKPDGAGWRYWFDSQYRVFDIGSGVSQVFARPALGYRLSNGVSLWAGYGYFNTRRSSGKRIDENRYWQQVETPAYSVADAAVAFRVRLEQRDVEIGNDLGWALRLRLKFSRYLQADSRWQAVASVEPFFALNDTDWGGGAGTSQIRGFLGLSRPLAKAALEFGYMNQLIRRGEKDTNNHLAVISLTTSF
jgi:hypothetical protein